MPSAQHSCRKPSWGTPPEIADDLAWPTLERIDLDPASSPAWNRRIRATRFYTRRQDGLSRPWTGSLRVFLNPPGSPDGRAVRAFWDKLVSHWQAGEVEAAIWVGFSLEQLARLQREADGTLLARPSPLHEAFTTVIIAKRVRYLQDSRGTRGRQPSHASFVTLLPALGQTGAEMIQRFHERASRLGHVINAESAIDAARARDVREIVAGIPTAASLYLAAHDREARDRVMVGLRPSDVRALMHAPSMEGGTAEALRRVRARRAREAEDRYQCGHCDYEEADGSLVARCATCQRGYEAWADQETARQLGENANEMQRMV